ncbi:hypothetical protein [Dietzia sp. 179-F 9C3 NHS]|uniref:hypothetical protein n=1 Tax=Dietzia sp. 179-F 9C3 NHS TaxID=3374295 RepID=UPI00387A2D30
MDLSGSLAKALYPALDSVYGSYMDGGGVGSMALNTLIELPKWLARFAIRWLGITGADLGSTNPI